MKELSRVSTTFPMDFSIADAFGIKAIKDTYRRSFRDFRSDIRYLAELTMTLNHKIWEHHERQNIRYAKLYDELWRKTEDYVYDENSPFTREEKAFFWRVLD